MSESDIRPDTLFELDGVQMTAEQAVSVGLLVHDGNGYRSKFSTPPASSSDPALQQKEEQEEVAEESAEHDHHSPEFREALNELDSKLGGAHQTEAAVNSVISHVTDGDMEKAAAAFSQRTGADPAEAAEFIHEAWQDAYDTVASTFTAHYGVNGRDLLATVENILPASQRKSFAYRCYLGDRSAFRELVDIYNRHELVSEIRERTKSGK